MKPALVSKRPSSGLYKSLVLAIMVSVGVIVFIVFQKSDLLSPADETNDKSLNHFIIYDRKMIRESCASELGAPMPYNENIQFPLLVETGSYKNYQLCFPKRPNRIYSYALEVYRVSEGDCDMYLSASSTYPNSIDFDWKADSSSTDKIVIKSTDPHFSKESNMLFVSVTGKAVMNECKLNLEIIPERASSSTSTDIISSGDLSTVSGMVDKLKATVGLRLLESFV